jgi:hypothetical protein
MTKHLETTSTTTQMPTVDRAAIKGLEEAKKLARFGQLISAIKYLEAANPELSRRQAKTMVDSFGYSSERRWPEMDRQPLRCL